MFLCLICVLFASIHRVISYSDPLPSCNVPVVYRNGYVDFSTTILNCSQVMPSALQIPSYWPGQPPTPISVQFVLHHLVSVNDVSQNMVIDITTRLTWRDSRWSMNYLFDELNANQYDYGIALDSLIAGGYLLIWLPNIQFVDEVARTDVTQSTMLMPNGTIYWTKRSVVTLSQGQLDFHAYPLDTQYLAIKIGLSSLPYNVAAINFTDNAVVFTNEVGGANSFAENDLWTYKGFTSTTLFENEGSISDPQYFSYGIVTITETRIGNGIITRLGIPMTCIGILTSLIFWLEISDRFSNTIYLLLTMSTLYISVSSNVPQVGYSTYLGSFGLSLLINIFVILFIHQFNYVLMRDGEKSKKYPFRLSYIRCIETFCKIFSIPLVLILFVIYFSKLYNGCMIYTTTIICCFVPIAIYKEYPGMIKQIASDMKYILENSKQFKVTPETPCSEYDKLMRFERILFNWYHYNRMTSSFLIIHRQSEFVGGNDGADGNNNNLQMNEMHKK